MEDDRDLDGECDEDPDYVKMPDGSYVPREEAVVPAGIRDEQGIIQPLSAQPVAKMNVDNVNGSETVHYGATRMDIPNCLDDLASRPSNSFILAQICCSLLRKTSGPLPRPNRYQGARCL